MVVVADVPSPKFQMYVQRSPRVPPLFESVLLSVNVAVRLEIAETNAATGV